MARIRSIKPEFPHSESMGRVSRDARLCFVLLWTLADDLGKLRGNSRMLASLLFPYDDDAAELIGDWLDELEAEHCIERHKVDGQTYVQIRNWLNHQKIDHASPSRFPELSESTRIVANVRECFAPDLGREGIGEEGRTTLSDSPKAANADDVVSRETESRAKAELREQLRTLIDFLNEHTGHHYRHVPANYEPLAARLKEGVSSGEVKAVIVRKTREWSGDDKMAKFLRPDTLFNRTKFHQYLGEVPPPEPVHAA